MNSPGCVSMATRTSSFPYGTLSVNVVGAALMTMEPVQVIRYGPEKR